MKIRIKNSDCGDVLMCDEDDSSAYVIYWKNKKWHLYGEFRINNQNYLDELMEEIAEQKNVSKTNIKLAKPLAHIFTEISYNKIQNNKLQKKKLMAQKRIDYLKKKFGL